MVTLVVAGIFRVVAAVVDSGWVWRLVAYGGGGVKGWFTLYTM